MLPQHAFLPPCRLAQKKKEHLFHPNCKQQTNEEELKRDNIHKNQLTEEERYSAWLRLHDDRKYVYEEREELRQRIEDYKVEEGGRKEGGRKKASCLRVRTVTESNNVSPFFRSIAIVTFTRR